MGTHTVTLATRWLGRLICAMACTAVLALPAGRAGESGIFPERDREPLQLASVHATIGPLEEERVWFGKRADDVTSVASLTKLMTAMVVLDSEQPLDEWLTIVERTHEVEKNAYTRMRIGSELTRASLLRIALMSSENLATHVLARHHPGGREAFIQDMNAKARSLGMTSTRFVDSSGLSAMSRSTASDMLKMVRAAYHYDHIRRFSTTPHHTARFRAPRYTLGYGNTNPLINHPRWDVQVSKTGYIAEAGRCLVMVAEVDGHPVAMVFLNSHGTRSPLGDAGRTRRWLTTGEGGVVAAAARKYEQQQAERLGGDR